MKKLTKQSRGRWLFLCLLSLLMSLGGVSSAWAATLTENFNSTLPTGWSLVGDATQSDTRNRSGNGVWSSNKSNDADYLITEAVEGSLTFYARAYNKSTNAYVIVYEYDGSKLGSQLYTTGNMYTTSNPPSWSSYTANLGNYKGQVAIALNYAAIDDLTYTQKEAAEGPALTVKDGSTTITSGDTYDFGLALSTATKSFTLSNPGTVAHNVSVKSVTGGYSAEISNSGALAADGGQVTLTIGMSSTGGDGVVTIESDNDGIDDFVINVTGTVRDPNKVYLDFSDGQIPDGWTSVAIGSYASSYGSPWAASTGYISQSGSSSSYAWAFTSPKLNFENGETICFETEKYSSSAWYTPSVTVEYTTDATGATGWTAIGSAFTDDTYGNWTKRSVTIPVEGVKRIRFNGWYLHMRNIYGGELPNEPKMVVTQPATLDFGLYEKDADPAPTKTFTIANTGLATLNGISVTSGNAAFTITNAPTSLAAGASQDVTITMSTATAGALSSLITVSATDMEDATFTVTGTVKPAGMAVEEFTDGLPSGWTNAYWTFADGKASGQSSSAYLTTPKLIVNSGDFFIFKIAPNDTYSGDYLTIQGSDDNGSTFTAYSKKIEVPQGKDIFANYVVSDIPTTINKLRFVGYYVDVDEIYGLTYAPQLSVTTGDPAAPVTTPANYDFGETTANATVTYNFANAGAGTISITGVAITDKVADSGAKDAYSTNWTESTAAPFDLVITRTYDSSRGGAAQEAVVTVTTTEGNFVINVTGTDKAANQPEMDFYIGDAVEKSTTGADLDFGLAAKGSTKSIKIQNDGTGALSITDITVPAGYTLKDGEDAVATPLAVAAGANKTLTLTLNEYGKQSGTLSFTADGIAEPFTFELSGAAYDDTALSFDFNDQKIPTDWTTTGGWSSYGDGNGGYCRENGGTSQSITTQKVTVTAGEVMIFQTRRYSDSSTPALTISYCATADGEFTTPENATFGAEDTPSASAWATQAVSTIPAGDWFIRFTGTYIDVDNVHMYHASLNDPKLAVYATLDGESTYSNAVTTGTSKDLGWAQDAQSFTYYIKNDKTGTLTINSVTNTNETDFTTTVVNDDNKNIAAGAALAFTVTMNAASIGEKTGTITLSTNVGDFEIPVKGFIYGDRNLVDFTNASQYTGWTGVNVTDNAATLSSTAIETMPFTATAGEKLYVEIKGNSSYITHSFSYSYSRDGGTNWSDVTTLIASTYSAVPDQIFTITDIADAEAASTVLIRFTGAGLSINRIYGFEALTAPVMTLDKTADYNFNMQTADAEYVITVTNTGTATLNNLAAALTTGENYSVAITKPDGETTTTVDALTGKATVPAGQQAIITVTQLFDANNGLATLSDVLTISGDDVTSKVINLSGQTRDGSKWYVDFSTNSPEGILSSTGWTLSSYYGYASVTTESALISKTLTIAANEKVQFDAKKMSYGTASLKVRHSLNGGLSWSDYTDFTDTEGFNSSAYKTMQYSVGNTEASAVAMMEFLGANVYLDNIYGGTLNNDAPMIQVKKNSTIVASGVTEEFGSISTATDATYTITNIGNGTLTITDPVAATGGATTSISATSLTNGQSATLTITMTPAEPYGEKSGAVTVATSLGNFVINYTATTMNPNALDFSDGNFPTGWYIGGWSSYSGYIYKNNSGTADFISQKLSVAGTSDVLKFDAENYGSTYASNSILKVSYSTDRVNWTEIHDYSAELTTSFQTFNVSGLAAGDYYLKFTGRYVDVDNIKGWTKAAAPTRDLYVASFTTPSVTKDAGDEVTISATVASLIDAQDGVYAKLFVDGEQVGDASTVQNIALNGTQTFSFDYTMPAAGTHTAQIKVYYSDNTEAFATAVKNMKVYYVFSETTNPVSITAGTSDVKLTHTMVEGWNTVCLPFATSVTLFGNDAVAYQFTGYNSSTKELTFTKRADLEAGVPYVVYCTAAITEEQIAQNVTVSATTASSDAYTPITFQGTYASMSAGSLTDAFGLTAAGKIVKAKSTTTMKGFRGYFTGVPAGARVSFFGDDDMTTGIKMITVENPSTEGVYNLQGQKVENLKKGGLYIINGKKAVIK